MKLTISLFNFIVDCDDFLNYVFLLSYVVGQRMKNKGIHEGHRSLHNTCRIDSFEDIKINHKLMTQDPGTMTGVEEFRIQTVRLFA